MQKKRKRLYTGRVRPVLEYGLTSWGNAAKSNFEVSRVQNQAARLITGAMKSTPIHELETITGLQPLEDLKDTKVLIQAAKLKQLSDHPMRDRLAQPTKARLKRGSFIHQSRILERRHQDIFDQDPKAIPQYLETLAWKEDHFPLIHCSVPCVGKKDTQSNAEKKAYTVEHTNNQYPRHSWTRVYTDGSAEQAVRSGGAGVYIKYPGGREESLSLATSCYMTNFKAAAVAIQAGATHASSSLDTSDNIVFFTDALSVLQALQSSRDKELNHLSAALSSLCRTHTVALQWLPSHCGVLGNETANLLPRKAPQKNSKTGQPPSMRPGPL
jgi:ribonuclease HI